MFAGASPAVPPAVAPENVVSLDRLSRLRVIDVGIAAAGGLERDVSLRLRHGALRDHPVFQLLAGNLVRAILHHRSEEHTSELQSLMRISYAVFCLKKKKINISQT